MTRSLALLALLTTSLGGCIIYETNGEDDHCFGDCDLGGGDGFDDGQGGQDTGDEPAPELPAFTFTAAEGLPGEVMLTWIEAEAPGFVYTNIESVTFVGDIEVVDTVLRDDEAMLLVEIAADALPGKVEAIVELIDGSAALIEGGFLILDPTADPGCSAGGTDPGAGGGTDPGAGGGTDPNNGGEEPCP